MANIASLTGTVKHYDWGGSSFIPFLLNIKDKENKKFAEYWLGVHPQADCTVVANNKPVLLREYINKDKPGLLGNYVYLNFGDIPYLLKALDVNDMLSIQVHPSKKEAEKDFAAENEKGIPLDSPQRNYKDTNHKPELMVAMDEFWLLHGFKPAELLEETLLAVPELNYLLPIFQIEGYTGLYKHVMELPQDKVNEQLQPLLDRIIPLYQSGELAKSSADYWAAKGALTFSQPGKTDRGIFSVYLFNLVQLQKGQAVFQDAGVPHAYLQGHNIEIMASSDNVLRGGLTPKHIDVKELLKHTKCEATHPDILAGEKINGQLVYKTPAPDFELSSFTIAKGETFSFTAGTAEILLLVQGSVEVSSNENVVVLKTGEPSAVVFPGDEVWLVATEDALVFKATVPVPAEK